MKCAACGIDAPPRTHNSPCVKTNIKDWNKFWQHLWYSLEMFQYNDDFLEKRFYLGPWFGVLVEPVWGKLICRKEQVQ